MVTYLQTLKSSYIVPVILTIILIVVSFIHDFIPAYSFVLALALLIVLRQPEFSATLFITGGIIFPTIYHVFEIDHLSALTSIYGLLFIGYLTSFMKDDNTFYLKGKPKFTFILTILIFFVLLFQTYRSPAFAYGKSKTLYFIVNNIMFYLIPYILFSTKKSLALIYKSGALLNILFVLISFFVLSKYGAGLRFEATGRGGVLIYARVLGLSVIFTLFALRSQSSISLKIIYSISIIASLIFMDLSGSRGPIILLLLSLLIYYLIFSKVKLHRKLIFASLGVFLAYITIVYLSPTMYDRFTLLRNDYSILLRLYSYTKAAEYFLLNPLLGWGTGSFMVLVNEWQKYPHNIFFELAMETGLIGLGIFTIFCAYLFYKFISIGKKFYNDHLFDLFGVTFIIFLFGFLTAQKSLDISYNHLLWFAAGALTIFQQEPRKGIN